MAKPAEVALLPRLTQSKERYKPFFLRRLDKFEMLKEELELYLKEIYPQANLNNVETLVNGPHIRFELGGNLENGTKARVEQASERAASLFFDTFNDEQNEIFILIYEDKVPDQFKPSNFFLYNQLPNGVVEKYTKLKSRNNVLVGKVLLKDINAANIIKGIANYEMGFEPSIGQRVCFFDLKNNRAFYMYDDRGCFIWSNNADQIRQIYGRRKEWIADYHRSEIDKFFEE